MASKSEFFRLVLKIGLGLFLSAHLSDVLKSSKVSSKPLRYTITSNMSRIHVVREKEDKTFRIVINTKSKPRSPDECKSSKVSINFLSIFCEFVVFP